jgi:undecaprenyl diphosphate synthase
MESQPPQMSPLPAADDLMGMLDRERLPRHVAVIMDGNGRWAEQRSLPRLAGHAAGAEAVRAVIEGCGDLGIEALTLYTFSSENWVRPEREVAGLMRIIAERLELELPELHHKNVRIRAIGGIDALPDFVQGILAESERLTGDNSGLRLYLAINYGGRTEILAAARSLAAAVAKGRMTVDDITEAVFASHLYAPDAPDPDLLIRTGGEMRVSNYLLWQIAYAEIVVVPTLWPDFRRAHLLHSLLEYQRRTRKFGGVPEDL